MGAGAAGEWETYLETTARGGRPRLSCAALVGEDALGRGAVVESGSAEGVMDGFQLAEAGEKAGGVLDVLEGGAELRADVAVDGLGALRDGGTIRKVGADGAAEVGEVGFVHGGFLVVLLVLFDGTFQAAEGAVHIDEVLID